MSEKVRPPMKPFTYTSDLYPEPRLLWPALAIGALGVWLGIHFEIGWYWCVLIGFSGLVGGCAIHWRATIDPADKTVSEEARLVGRRLLWKRRHSLQDFDAVIFALLDNDPQQWGVGVRHRSGRKIWIKECGSATGQRPPGRAAEEFAWRLSCDTGLEIEDYKPNSHA